MSLGFFIGYGISDIGYGGMRIEIKMKMKMKMKMK